MSEGKVAKCLPLVDSELSRILTPRWLVTVWNKIQDGDRMYVEPDMFESLRVLSLYPDHETFGFHIRLSLRRESEYERMRLNKLSESSARTFLEDKFEQHPDSPGIYAIGVRVNHDAVTGGGERAPLKPDIGVRVMVAVKNKGRWAGETIEDHFNYGSDFVLAVKGKANADLNPDNFYPLYLSWTDDPVPIKRRIQGMRRVEQGQKRGFGAD